ncbi:hypothetical protein [Cohnella cellulosilytica]|uniref:Uncharacterized protein n=2 Tax=Cohnella cellulosilytica TaxID=986710 RepID=A0ABW2FH57_9BACL
MNLEVTMARITIQYDDGRPDEIHDAAQFILFHVPPSETEEQLIMTAQCSAEFLRDSVTEENARGYYKQAFKAMSQKRLGEKQ